MLLNIKGANSGSGLQIEQLAITFCTYTLTESLAQWLSQITN